MSKAKLVKQALKNAHMYAPAEVAYFRMWLQKRKEKKAAKKRLERLNLERTFLMS
jgi:hypothetical protein